MDATKGRAEEFGAAPWTVVLAALLLAIAVSNSLFHAKAAPHARPAAIHATRSGGQ